MYKNKMSKNLINKMINIPGCTGAFCKCGNTLYIANKKRKAITTLECRCGRTVQLLNGSLFSYLKD